MSFAISPFSTKFDDVASLLNHPDFYWRTNGCQNLKYLNIRVDTRDNTCVVTDRYDRPVNVDNVLIKLKQSIVQNQNLKKSASEWLATPEFEGITVIDPDGWDRSRLPHSWGQSITKAEFQDRLAKSTISYNARSNRA